jgi:MoaD family protein
MKLKLYSNLRDIAGSDEVNIDLSVPVTLADFLRKISDDYGERMRKFLMNDKNEIEGSILLFINGERISNLENNVSNEDELTILLPLAGG